MATLTDEITFIWRRPKALSAMSFLISRYLALVGNIYGLYVDFSLIPDQAASFGQYAGNLTISPGVGCFTTYTAEISARLGLAWVAILAFEALIFVLTVYQTCKSRGLSRLRLVTRRNILDVMFHDGVMYFGAMTLCNIPNIVMYYYGPAVIRGNVGLSIFTSCMSVTLISRLMLNLHKSADSGILSVPAQDDDYCLSVFTTSISIQSAIA
ncbi:hypothetical protein EV424DRAFT_1545103 [Suillus variegatus]|nr:hypothetical protein EV424DRAFT_1545103 [Suillus variegatus]